MNLFVTDPDPFICATHHCQVHLRKMPTETAQMLSTAHVVLSGKQVGYKSISNPNHRCAVWVRETSANYAWTFNLFVGLLHEYWFRTGRTHKTQNFRHLLCRNPAPAGPLTPFALSMPEEFKQADPFLAYQEYLNVKFLEWRDRKPTKEKPKDRPIPCEFLNRSAPHWLDRRL